MEESEQVAIDSCRGNVEGERHYSKHIQYMDSTISYRNDVIVSKSEGMREELEVKNYVAYLEDKTIVKRLQIYFQDSVIRIQDSYAPCPSQALLKEEEQKEDQKEQEIKSEEQSNQERSRENKKPKRKKYLLEKRGHERNGTTGSKKIKDFKVKDTKNVVKNIYRLFQKWVAKHLPPELLLQESLETLFRNIGRYNNDLILQLCSQGQIKNTFLAFSGEVGQELIESSKIKDKEAHLQALAKYRQICLEGVQVQHQKSWSEDEMKEHQGRENF